MILTRCDKCDKEVKSPTKTFQAFIPLTSMMVDLCSECYKEFKDWLYLKPENKVGK